MNTILRSAVTFAAGTVVALALAASPAGASYQGGSDNQPPPVVIDVDCISILSRVLDLNQMVDDLNGIANDAWSDWESGSTSNQDMMNTIRDMESAATQVTQAYGLARDAWKLEGCLGTLPPLNSFDYPWRELGL
jgi:hypothetical protein